MPIEDQQRLSDLLDVELRASMRANGRRTSRHTIVFETLRYHLKIRPVAAPEHRRRIVDLFRFRGWAVHADSKFKPAVEREDVRRGVDWHYAAFRSENAVAAVGGTLQMLSSLVDVFQRGSDELRDWQLHVRAALDAVLERYDAEPRLPRLQWRAEAPADGATTAEGR